MNEDETFKRLARSTFEEVRLAVLDNTLRHVKYETSSEYYLQDRKDIIEAHGWTEEEYAVNYSKSSK